MGMENAQWEDTLGVVSVLKRSPPSGWLWRRLNNMSARGTFARNAIKGTYKDAKCYKGLGEQYFVKLDSELGEIVATGRSPLQTWRRAYEKLFKEGKLGKGGTR
jgi:hypothetical protein